LLSFASIFDKVSRKIQFMYKIKIFTSIIIVFGFTTLMANDPNHSPLTEAVPAEEVTTLSGKEDKFDPTDMILDHIGNSNEFHLFGDFTIPLPCILYSKEDGLNMFMSSKFEHGHMAYNRYVSDHGTVRRINDPSFPMGEVHLESHIEHEKVEGGENGFIEKEGKRVALEKASGLLAMTSFYDFSISKNVFTMLLAALFMLITFLSIANTYKKREGLAPKGLQNFFEPIIQFIRDDVAIPMLGDKYMTYLPFLLTMFFFILICNLMGLIPFFPFGSNVTGNIATTAALALITFLLVNLNGKKDYWKHIFWMPDVPVAMKFFLAPIELIGIFTKPISLMIRLFANITAGHIIILSLVGLIFVFGNAGKSIAGASAGIAVAVPFTLFLNVIELIVAMIQAFIFTILSASYIGAAIEEHHHDEKSH
jgi:F-type H+-transporting ATPase subunit a